MFRTFMCVAAVAIAVALLATPSSQLALAQEGSAAQAKKTVWQVHHHGKDKNTKGAKVLHSSHDTEQAAKAQKAALEAAGYVFVEILSLLISFDETADVLAFQATARTLQVVRMPLRGLAAQHVLSWTTV